MYKNSYKDNIINFKMNSDKKLSIVIPPLPDYLKYLDCSSCSSFNESFSQKKMNLDKKLSIVIPPLPDSLKYLDCSSFESLPLIRQEGESIEHFKKRFKLFLEKFWLNQK